MSNLERVKSLNKIAINSLDDKSFNQFGKKLSNEFLNLTKWLEENTVIPEEGNIYIGSVPELENISEYNQFFSNYYGELPWQIGYCNGANSTLNGLEYHKGDEITVAVTDFVLLLGLVQDIDNNTFSVEHIQAFFVNKGDAFALYGTTLHFAPCKLTKEGFKAIIVLPKGTNQPLDSSFHKSSEEDKLLFAKNKWLLAHSDRKPLIDKGAFPGIIGENIKVCF